MRSLLVLFLAANFGCASPPYPLQSTTHRNCRADVTMLSVNSLNKEGKRLTESVAQWAYRFHRYEMDCVHQRVSPPTGDLHEEYRRRLAAGEVECVSLAGCKILVETEVELGPGSRVWRSPVNSSGRCRRERSRSVERESDRMCHMRVREGPEGAPRHAVAAVTASRASTANSLRATLICCFESKLSSGTPVSSLTRAASGMGRSRSPRSNFASWCPDLSPTRSPSSARGTVGSWLSRHAVSGCGLGVAMRPGLETYCLCVKPRSELDCLVPSEDNLS